jgi:CDP-4-dehydro-6-deoxyglucose reductase, E1
MRNGLDVRVPVSGQISGDEEINALIDVARTNHWAGGRKVVEFERAFSKFHGYKHGIFVNSGSSANLLAIGAREWMHPVKVSACSFPTTVNPIIQSGNTPYFVDVEIGTYLPKYPVDVGCHVLGNYCTSGAIIDSCDGCFPGEDTRTATFSFFPAHFMSTGEGGMVLTNDTTEFMRLRSTRDWGRDCWCEPGHDDTCGHRFDYTIDGVQYDHKYTYSNIGYNLKATDLQAAVGLEQLKKLPGFLEKRRSNFAHLYENLADTADWFYLPISYKPNTAWFGFPLTIREDAPFTRREITRYLEDNGVATRLMFGGNITRQPAYKYVDYDADPLPNADLVFSNGFWIGSWHGLSFDQLDYASERIYEFLSKV